MADDEIVTALLAFLCSVASAHLLVLTLSGCSGQGTQRQEPAPVIRPQPGSENCGRVCERFLRLSPDGGACEEGLAVPTRDGGTLGCAEFCIYQHENGVFWNTECLLQVQSCEAIEGCAE